MAVLTFEQLCCVRDEQPLFHPLTFTVQPGDILQVVGPNGAGKTTLLRAISGLFDDVQGTYSWDQQPIAAKTYERTEQLMYLGHQPGVKSAMTAMENLHWFLGLRTYSTGVITTTDIERALQQVGLSGYEDTPCYQMSAGQQRRVALARLYLINTPVWVLDEPFTAIDKHGVARLEQRMSDHANQGGSVIVTSHQPVLCAGLKTLELSAYTPPATLNGGSRGGVNNACGANAEGDHL